MPNTVFLSPAAQGKTEQAVRHITAMHLDGPLRPIVALLLSHAQVKASRARRQAADWAIFGVDTRPGRAAAGDQRMRVKLGAPMVPGGGPTRSR